VRVVLDRIRAAVDAIDPVFRDSPQYECGPLGGALGCSVTLKVETLNPVRCFKGRGTDNVIASLDGTAAVCASAGNLGQALAYSGVRRGVTVTVVAGRSANPLKVERMRELGATVLIEGEDIEAARVAAERMAADEGIRLVEDSLDVETCEGAGTIGLELLEDGGRIDSLLIALGGGAMATGIGCVAKALAPEVEVVTVQPAGAPAMTLSWRRREVVETETMDTIADGVAGRCPIPEVLDDLLEVVDDAVLVSEDSIKDGMRLLHLHAGLVTEPSAALGVAAVLENRERFAGRRVATVVCGSNVALADFERWMRVAAS
jgi:threonine dehydratase